MGGEQHGYARIFIRMMISNGTFAFYTKAVVDQLEPDEYKRFKEHFEEIRKHING